MDCVRELSPEEFNERLMPIFLSVGARFSYPGGDFNPGYFFPHWRKLMSLGVARTWEMPGDAVLGALFAENTFTGKKNGLVHFWFKRDGAPSALPLLSEAIEAARGEGCILFHSASYRDLHGEKMDCKYYRLGFEESERIFRKIL